MASERQIEANRKNAGRSTGPKTNAGKAKSRANATKHGMAIESSEVEAGLSPEFIDRRAKWGAEQKPVGETAEWALDRAVAASLRIERCERTLEDFLTASRTRASLVWDEDRAAEAARLGSKLATDPALVSRLLETSLAGVCWLMGGWLDLVGPLEAGKDWSEVEDSRSMDLLGRPPESREVHAAAEGGGSSRIAARLELARSEIERLQALRDEAFQPLDEVERRLATQGDLALLSKPATRILRYERDAWRRYREAMAQVRPATQAPVPTAKVALPLALTVDAPAVTSAKSEPPPRSSEEIGRRTEAWETSPRFAPLSHPGRPEAGGRNEPNCATNFSIGKACG